jgi:hypothetical protein
VIMIGSHAIIAWLIAASALATNLRRDAQSAR